MRKFRIVKESDGFKIQYRYSYKILWWVTHGDWTNYSSWILPVTHHDTLDKALFAIERIRQADDERETPEVVYSE